MSETPEEIIERVSDVIAGMALDAVVKAREHDPLTGMSDVFDDAAFMAQVARLLRDNCKELWEESAAEVDAEKFRLALMNIDATARRWAVANGGDTPLALIARMARETLGLSADQVDARLASLKER